MKDRDPSPNGTGRSGRPNEPDDQATIETTQSGTVEIRSEDDIIRARQAARTVVEETGFRLTDVTRIVTAVSELARNVHLYAGEGVMRWREIREGSRSGIEMTFEDDGPGIEDVDAVLQGEYSTSNGMGRGIAGTKKLMDDIQITSEAGEGTTVTIRKWQR